MGGLLVGLVVLTAGDARADDPSDAVRIALAAVGEPLPAGVDVADRVFLVLTINPEGRVRTDRGPFTPELTRGRTTYAVVKVVNQSGGRPRLTPLGRYEGGANPFTLSMTSAGGLPLELSGVGVEYRLLAVTGSAGGRHELAIGFEAGQGTQDLAFRGEAAVLFTVRDRPSTLTRVVAAVLTGRWLEQVVRLADRNPGP